jgi:hypothetical protein
VAVVQAVEHLVPLQAKPPGHVVALPATQSPLPSHELVVCVTPVHALAQVVLAFGKKQVAGPTAGEQEPAHALAPAHAARVPWGVPVTWEHMPSEPATSQAWHWSVHAELQQTPSTQTAVPAHASAVGQGDPWRTLATQVPALQ